MDNIYNAFSQLENEYPLPDRVDPVTYRPTFDGVDPQTGMYTAPVSVQHAQYYNSERYCEPFVSSFFGSSVPMVEAFEDPSWVPVNDRRLDPNKIFTPDIQALKTLAADEIKIVRLFEKRLIESLSEKGKFGLTEDDVNAMQALTSARSAVANINKEQVNVKKVIADIRLKQQMNNKEANQAGGPSGPTNSFEYNQDIGRNMMDNLFATAVSNSYVDTTGTTYEGATPVDPDSEMLNAILPNTSESLKAEVMEGAAVVVVGVDDRTAHFEGRIQDDNKQYTIHVDDYPLPTTNIKTIDRQAHKAYDDLGQEYPLREEIPT